MTLRLAKAWTLAFTCFWAQLLLPTAHAQLAVPPLSGHVVDQTGALSADQKALLEQQLAAFEASKGSQIAVLIVPTTAPEAIEPYTLRVAEKWKLGRKKVDDGAILVIAKDDRTLRIEVGYGLEGALSDAISKRIIDETIVPRFRQQDFAGGIAAGAVQMMAVVNGEPLPAPVASPQSQYSNDGTVPPSFIAALVALVIASLIARAVMGALVGSLVTAGLAAGAAWLLTGVLVSALVAAGAAFFVTLVGVLNLLSLFMRSGGYGGGGGRGGGGFSGGGGGFGGGGASGRW